MSDPPYRDRLDSWKEIAAYLGRDVRTVRRWEKEQELPVHRHHHHKAASIYAYKTELDMWWANGRERLCKEKDDADEAGGQEVVAAVERSGSLSRLRIVGVALVVALLLVGAGFLSWSHFHPKRAASHPIMLAVLPFQNLTGEPAQEFVSDGFTEEMITQLGGLRYDRLGVIARTSAMAYKNTLKPVNQIGRELGVDYVLEGSVRRWGDRVRVTAQLIRTQDQTHLWAQNYESDRQDVLKLQSEIAQAITEQIQVALSVEDRARLDHARVIDPQVYELSLLGRYEWNKRTEAGLVQAISYFQQAIARDPNYAPAHAGLAEAYLVSAFYSRGSAREFYDKAHIAAQRAVELNELTFQAHTTLGMVASSYLRVGAEREFKRALAINPNYATAHHWYAFYLWRVGRHEEALAEVERARLLDPVSPIINTDEAVFRVSAGQIDQAIRQLQQMLDIDPGFSEAHRSLAIAYAKQHKLSDALVEARRALDLNPNNVGARATVGYVEAVLGHREQAEALLRQIQSAGDGKTAPRFFEAWIYVGLGRNSQAMDCLEQEYRERSPMMVAIAVEPIFEPLRTDARFVDLLEHIRTGD